MNKSEGKRKYVIQLNNLFKKRSNKPEAPASNDVEDGKTSQDEDDNAPPSESTVIVEDEPQKKVREREREFLNIQLPDISSKLHCVFNALENIKFI